MTKFFQSIRVWSVSASFGAALVMGGVVGSPTGPFAPQAAQSEARRRAAQYTPMPSEPQTQLHRPLGGQV